MVYTNINYINQKICQNNLKKLIKLTNFNKYELDVNTTNSLAIKCYENIGFKFIKEYEIDNNKYNLMEYNNLH